MAVTWGMRKCIGRYTGVMTDDEIVRHLLAFDYDLGAGIIHERALDHARTVTALGGGEHEALRAAHVYVADAAVAVGAWWTARQAVEMLDVADRGAFGQVWADAPPSPDLAAICQAIAGFATPDEDYGLGVLASDLPADDRDEIIFSDLTDRARGHEDET